MKRFIVLLIILFTIIANFTTQAFAHNSSKCNCHCKNHYSHYPSNYIISEVTNISYLQLNNCDKHQIEKQTTITYYSNSSPTTIHRYAAYDDYGNMIIDNCISIEHVVYKNKCFFIIKFYDNKIFSLNSKAAIISDNNNFEINKKYNLLIKTYDNRYIAKLDGKYGLIDIEENQIAPFMYDAIDKLCVGLYKTKINGMYGVMDSNGKIILNCQYDTVKKLGSNHYQIKQNKKWGILSNDGKIIAPVIYKDVKISKNILYVKDNNNNWMELNHNINY